MGEGEVSCPVHHSRHVAPDVVAGVGHYAVARGPPLGADHYWGGASFGLAHARADPQSRGRSRRERGGVPLRGGRARAGRGATASARGPRPARPRRGGSRPERPRRTSAQARRPALNQGRRPRVARRERSPPEMTTPGGEPGVGRLCWAFLTSLRSKHRGCPPARRPWPTRLGHRAPATTHRAQAIRSGVGRPR